MPTIKTDESVYLALVQTRVAAFAAGLLVSTLGVGLLFGGLAAASATVVVAVGTGAMASAFVMPPGLW